MPEEMEFVLDAIDFVAEHGHKFLPLYEFDWRTGAWDFAGIDDKIVSSAGPMKLALRRCRAIGEAAIRRCRPLLEGGGSKAAPPYRKYLRQAREIAAVLMVCATSKSSFPEDVDPQLVTFMV